MLREWIHRLLGTMRRGRRDTDLEEELRLHMELAAEDAQRRGEPVRAARLHTGGVSQAMEALRDQRGWPWLQSLSSDLVFAWRQLTKHPAATLVAVLSLGLAIGATTTAFRLVNAVLWRTMPVAEPDRLFVLGWNAVSSQGGTEYRDEDDYPTFRRYVEATGPKADLMVVGIAGTPQPILVDGAVDTERVTRQFLSGNVFPIFGLQPAVGRLLTRSDDVTPGAHPVAVISYEYWTRRFARAPTVVGTRFRFGAVSYEIVGVAPRGFTGTEPGRLTDVFIPAAMNVQALNSRGFSWFRIFVKPRPGVSAEEARQPLQAEFTRQHHELLKYTFPPNTPKQQIDRYLGEQLLLVSAGRGASGPQRNLRRPLLILSALVTLVLLIACANVANLLTARAMTRTREMALRVSIGAGRGRLIQLLLVESLLLAVCASAAGALFAWWAAPVVISLVDLGVPLQLVLDADWRTIAFGLALPMTVTILFGLAPAVRGSSIQPLDGLKDAVSASSHRLTRTLVGVQTTFCVFVLFVAGLMVTTFVNLSSRPLGFDYRRALLVDTLTSTERQATQPWSRLADQLRAMPGVESVALAMWVPLSQNRWRAAVRVPGRAVVDSSAFVLGVSGEYFETMGLLLIAGRSFRPGDTGVAIVNESLARTYFGGDDPIGKAATLASSAEDRRPIEIVGVVQDAAYFSVREAMRPTVYVPAEGGSNRTLIVRATGDPVALVPAVRGELSRMRSEFRATNVEPYTALVARQMVFERLLAILSLFFAGVALLLAGLGLYGVLNFAVIQRRREIGVRMALGARAADVVRRVTNDVLRPACIGTIVGFVAGVAFGRLLESMLFEVKATDAMSVAAPLVTLALAAAVAALPPAIRAVRIDPARTLRSE
jgi:putative ABC transport system permease protein